MAGTSKESQGAPPPPPGNPGTRELGNAGTWEPGNAGTRELGNSGTREHSRVPRGAELGNSGTERGNSGTRPEFRRSRNAGIREHQPGTRERSRVPEFPDSQVPGGRGAGGVRAENPGTRERENAQRAELGNSGTLSGGGREGAGRPKMRPGTQPRVRPGTRVHKRAPYGDVERFGGDSSCSE